VGAQALIEDQQNQGHNFPESGPNNATPHPRKDGLPSSPSRQQGLAKNRDIFALELCPTLHPIVAGVLGVGGPEFKLLIFSKFKQKK
jgi:hypothetical protein